MTGSFNRNRFGYFPELSVKHVLGWYADLQFWTVRERYKVLCYVLKKLLERLV